MKMKWCVLFLMICVFSLNNSFAETTNPYNLFKFTKTYQSSAGNVAFSHDRHADIYAKDCDFCHSALKVFGGKVNKLFAHNFCNSCHMQKPSIASKDCGGCHAEPINLSMK